MSKTYINNKSQQTTIRVPHDVLEAMEFVKQDGESNAGFIVTAMRGEIARRQAGGAAESSLVSAIDALNRIKEIGSKAGEEINSLVHVAEVELERTKTSSEPKS